MTRTQRCPLAVLDACIRRETQHELEWDPEVPSTNVGISVTDHTVTLSGWVHTRAQRDAAVKAARRVKPVHAIVDNIVVAPTGHVGTSDQDIATSIERLFESSSTVPAGITATVRHGLVILTGCVERQSQKAAALRAIRDLRGVIRVQNDVIVKAHPSSDVVRSMIVSDFHRNADLESKDIDVVAVGHEVWLTGHTDSPLSKMQASIAAWSVPGVESVHNDILVDP